MEVYFPVEADDKMSALEKGHEILRAAGADTVRLQDLEVVEIPTQPPELRRDCVGA